MGVTAITRLENRSSGSVRLLNYENANTRGHGVWVAPGQSLAVDMWVPWAQTQQDFSVHHLELHIGPGTTFWIWQGWTAEDGDHVRFSADGAWHDHGRPVHGVSAVSGHRTLVVRDRGFELTAFPAELLATLRTVLGSGGYHLASQCGDRPVPSVPKSSAVAFSMAGLPSDAFRRGQPQARFLYRDTGKRYRFELRQGVVVALHPDGTETPLTQAISFSHKRRGETCTAPPFDLIAANGGRVFAKEQGWDRFYFTTMDHMFIHATDTGGELAVPSAYFKLDPEFNQLGARTQDLVAPFEGCFGGHPATVRFPLFQLALQQNLIDMMMVAVQPRVWHLIDVRPPLGVFNLEVLAVQCLLEHSELGPVFKASPPLQQLVALTAQAVFAPNITPPAGVPTYPSVTYASHAGTFQQPGLDFDQVLDIGVGHVHWHEQYEGTTGGELQPLRTGPFVGAPLPPLTYADLYRFANGPVHDGDGYIDGTCNYYALVRLKTGAFALLYLDEQSYFTQRWRLVDPDDAQGLSLALVTDLRANPTLYGWKPEAYWCPFRAGEIQATSRLAVSRQVLLVSAPDPQPPDPVHPTAVLYSINFSYATMDHSWRWRRLPGQAEYFLSDAARASEPIAPHLPNRVYPETMRLRDDMTIHVKGTQQRPHQGILVGRWYQRYLPADNQLVPPPACLTGSRPTRLYKHDWKFLPEPVFQAADRFSHFGVYASVDARTQYYVVVPASDADAQALDAEAADAAPWVDTGHQLCTRLLEFQWAAPLGGLDVDLGRSLWSLHIVGPPKSPPSLFNPETRLRIVRRGRQWIAMHWDKRDDDLIPFDGLPCTVTLARGAHTATVTLHSHTWVEPPPAVHSAEWAWTGDPQYPVTLTLSPPARVWRVHLAALDPIAPPLAPAQPVQVVTLLDVELEGNFVASPDGLYRFRWAPRPSQQRLLGRYCTAAGALQYGTSLWFEDLVGHVSVPDALRWVGTPPLTASEAVVASFI